MASFGSSRDRGAEHGGCADTCPVRLLSLLTSACVEHLTHDLSVAEGCDLPAAVA